LVERLAGETALASRWPTDDEVKVAVKNSPLYLTMTRARLRMIFEAIEDHLRTEKTEPGFSRSKLTIEHLMPQGWTDEVWPLPDRPSAEERRAELIHTMGNLTLVTGKLNPSLSNGSWQNKRSGLSSHSVLRLNHELLDRYSEWDEDSIDERSAELGDVVTAIWPRR